jgi:NAD+ kinase
MKASTPVQRLGIIYHPKIANAKALAEQLSQLLPSLGATAWISSSWDEESIRDQLQETDLVLSIGGDGTILRVARAVTTQETPILGVNVGHLGFMTEFRAEDIVDNLPQVINGEGWIDQRAMLEIDLIPTSNGDSPKSFYALNDVVVGRGAILRVVYIKTTIDSELLTTYKADGLIISTATGSTGYSLAAGGPILHPQSEEIMLNPIAAHLNAPYALVLPSTVIIELEVSTDHEAMLSIDGQLNFRLQDGDKVRTKRSSRSARFLRMHQPNFFYSALEERLKGKN